MPRRSKPRNAEQLRQELVNLLKNFRQELESGTLRSKVLALIPAYHLLRDLGSSLVLRSASESARDRILLYFKQYPQTIIHGEEIMVIAGIGEWGRRVRELRVQFGWDILTGVTAKEMAEDGDFLLDTIDVDSMGPDDYILISDVEDRDAAHRWNMANEIRKKKLGVRDKIIEYMRRNVGKQVTGEELRYLAKDAKEWARRVRELRTELGWPIVTRNTGRPDLPVGTYLLEEDRQSPAHDRKISDPLRIEVLRRDRYTCVKCGWTHENWNRSDPRHLELHHTEPHAKGGENVLNNLITVCTICHDDIHRHEK